MTQLNLHAHIAIPLEHAKVKDYLKLISKMATDYSLLVCDAWGAILNPGAEFMPPGAQYSILKSGAPGMENLNRDQRDSVFKACKTGPYI